ncbi:hypothetical protein FB451DRAFT_1173300 [Mycena latifolia]|nr:hypothetical protein FB451DRAFT_1173300 [Mycena latifolia]
MHTECVFRVPCGSTRGELDTLLAIEELADVTFLTLGNKIDVPGRAAAGRTEKAFDGNRNTSGVFVFDYGQARQQEQSTNTFCRVMQMCFQEDAGVALNAWPREAHRAPGLCVRLAASSPLRNAASYLVTSPELQIRASTKLQPPSDNYGGRCRRNISSLGLTEIALGLAHRREIFPAFWCPRSEDCTVLAGTRGNTASRYGSLASY